MTRDLSHVMARKDIREAISPFSSEEEGQEMVTDDEGKPVRNTAHLGHTKEANGAVTNAAATQSSEGRLSAAAFKAAVRGKVGAAN